MSRAIARALIAEVSPETVAELAALIGPTTGGGDLQNFYDELAVWCWDNDVPVPVLAACVDAEEVQATYGTRLREGVAQPAGGQWQWSEVAQFGFFENHAELAKEALS